MLFFGGEEVKRRKKGKGKKTKKRKEKQQKRKVGSKDGKKKRLLIHSNSNGITAYPMKLLILMRKAKSQAQRMAARAASDSVVNRVMRSSSA